MYTKIPDKVRICTCPGFFIIDRLLNGHMSVTEIAVDVGFSTTSHYCESFRNHYGITPKQYKKESDLKFSEL